MRKQEVFLFLALALVIGLTAVPLTMAAETEEQQEEDARILVPDFALQTYDGETIRLSDYQGKIVVLNFWASWCPPCKAEMPEFQALHNDLIESEDAVLLLLNQIDGRQETVERGTNYLLDNGLTMTNLLDYGTVGRQIFGVPGLPTTVVIDAEGYFSSYVTGPTTAATVWAMIEGAK